MRKFEYDVILTSQLVISSSMFLFMAEFGHFNCMPNFSVQGLKEGELYFSDSQAIFHTKSFKSYYIREGECLEFNRVLKLVSTCGGAPLLRLSPVSQVMTIAALQLSSYWLFWRRVFHIVGESILYIVPAGSAQICHFPPKAEVFAGDSTYQYKKYSHFEPMGIPCMMIHVTHVQVNITCAT